MKRAIPESGKVISLFYLNIISNNYAVKSSKLHPLFLIIFSNQIAKDARECVQECVSEFISFITSEASERCFLEKRKTINGEDILFAMSSLGFDNYIEPLKIYLQKYREVSCRHRIQFLKLCLR